VLTAGRGKLLGLDGRETGCEWISPLGTARLKLCATEEGGKKVPFRNECPHVDWLD